MFGISIYFASHTWSIIRIGWIPAPNTLVLVLASITIPIAIEGGRRMAGFPYVIICLIMGLYPLIAEHLPGFLYGLGLSLFNRMMGYPAILPGKD